MEHATKRLAYVHVNKVLRVKAVNYNAKINVTIMVAVLQKHLNVHCVIVNRASEVSVAKYKLAALLEKRKHVLEMAIVSEANAIVTLVLVAKHAALNLNVAPKDVIIMATVDMDTATATQDTKVTIATLRHHAQKVVAAMANAGMDVVIVMLHFPVQHAQCQLSAQKAVASVVFVSVVNVNAKWVSVVKHVKLPLHQKDVQEIAQCMVIAMWENAFAIQIMRVMIVHVT